LGAILIHTKYIGEHPNQEKKVSKSLKNLQN
jgi:hypothetical protein